MLLGLCGAKRSGKDTVASILVEEHGFKRLAFADAIRDALYALDPIVIEELNVTEVYSYRLTELVDSAGWEDAKKVPEVRRLLQHMGFEAIRQFDDNFWVDVVFKQIDDVDENYVITDVRFLNEVQAVEAYDGTVYRVRRDSAENHGDTHTSETQLAGLEFKEIPNNGTLEELRVIVSGLV